jgi:energy-coupling factor transporter ATP-binding protein EcfA2
MKHRPNSPKSIYEALMNDMKRERFALHGSAFVISNQTILLVGPSGVGKSTLRNFLIDSIGGLVIQDDKPQLLMHEGLLCVTGNPYVSENYMSYSDSIHQLHALYILKKSDHIYIKKSNIDILTFWSRFGIGISEDTNALEYVLKKLREIPLYDVGVTHDQTCLEQFKTHLFDKIFNKN